MVRWGSEPTGNSKHSEDEHGRDKTNVRTPLRTSLAMQHLNARGERRLDWALWHWSHSCCVMHYSWIKMCLLICHTKAWLQETWWETTNDCSQTPLLARLCQGAKSDAHPHSTQKQQTDHRIFPGYTARVAKARAAFTEVRKMLHNWPNVQFGPLFDIQQRRKRIHWHRKSNGLHKGTHYPCCRIV